MNETILDVIPIYKNEMYPTKDSIYHFRNRSEVPKEILIKYMIQEISNKFFDCDCVIILENGKVIDILGKNKDFVLRSDK